MITGYLVGGEVSSTSQQAFSLYDSSRLGEKKGSRIIYSPVEALYLVGEGKMSVFSGKKELGEREFEQKVRRLDAKIDSKLPVFVDLKKKGFIVKTALKFGAEFRVYDKGVKPGEDHARWVVQSVRDSEKINWQDFAAKNRVAHSTHKRLLLALVDQEGAVNYYEIGWFRP